MITFTLNGLFDHLFALIFAAIFFGAPIVAVYEHGRAESLRMDLDEAEFELRCAVREALSDPTKETN